MNNSGFAIIYDRYDTNTYEWVEDMYEVFADAEEATEIFHDYAQGIGFLNISNPRLVQIIEPIEPPEDHEWG